MENGLVVKTVKIEIQDGHRGNLEFSINHQILKGDIAKTARWPSVFRSSDVGWGLGFVMVT